MPNSEEDAWLKDSVSGRGLATGDNIIVRLSKGQTLEGRLFAMDEQQQLIVISQEGRNPMEQTFRMMQLDMIEELQLIESQSLMPAMERLPRVDVVRMRKKEAMALERAQRELVAANPDASREGQLIFHALSRTMACSWRPGAEIAVLEDVVIGPPYTVDQCRLTGVGDNAAALERVRKVLHGERSKLGLSDVA